MPLEGVCPIAGFSKLRGVTSLIGGDIDDWWQPKALWYKGQSASGS